MQSQEVCNDINTYFYADPITDHSESEELEEDDHQKFGMCMSSYTQKVIKNMYHQLKQKTMDLIMVDTLLTKNSKPSIGKKIISQICLSRKKKWNHKSLVSLDHCIMQNSNGSLGKSTDKFHGLVLKIDQSKHTLQKWTCTHVRNWIN